jgi:hypothetical protein
MSSDSVDQTPFVFRRLCKASDFDSLLGKGLQGQAAEGCVRSVFVIVDPPLFNALTGIVERQEPGRVQALDSRARVEGFDKPVEALVGAG